MTKILVIGADASVLEVLKVMRERIPDVEFIVQEHAEAPRLSLDQADILMYDEGFLKQPLTIEQQRTMHIHDLLLLECTRPHYPVQALNPSERYYHKHTQPYGRKHRQRF